MRDTGCLIALDLAAKYGVAVVDEAGRFVHSRHGLLLGASRQRRRLQLSKQIADLIDEFDAAWIAIEKPINAGRMSSYETLRSLYGYADVAEDVAAVRECGFLELARSTCCKNILGNGNATKADGVAWCQSLKPGLTSEDEADAILVAMAAHQYRVTSRERVAT